MQRRGSTLKGITTLLLMVVNVCFWVPILMVVGVVVAIHGEGTRSAAVCNLTSGP